MCKNVEIRHKKENLAESSVFSFLYGLNDCIAPWLSLYLHVYPAIEAILPAGLVGVLLQHQDRRLVVLRQEEHRARFFPCCVTRNLSHWGWGVRILRF